MSKSEKDVVTEMFAGTSWTCTKTGDVITLPDEIFPRQFFRVGESYLDVGDGYYCRMGGWIVKVEESKE